MPPDLCSVASVQASFKLLHSEAPSPPAWAAARLDEGLAQIGLLSSAADTWPDVPDAARPDLLTAVCQAIAASVAPLWATPDAHQVCLHAVLGLAQRSQPDCERCERCHALSVPLHPTRLPILQAGNPASQPAFATTPSAWLHRLRVSPALSKAALAAFLSPHSRRAQQDAAAASPASNAPPARWDWELLLAAAVEPLAHPLLPQKAAQTALLRSQQDGGASKLTKSALLHALSTMLTCCLHAMPAAADAPVPPAVAACSSGQLLATLLAMLRVLWACCVFRNAWLPLAAGDDTDAPALQRCAALETWVRAYERACGGGAVPRRGIPLAWAVLLFTLDLRTTSAACLAQNAALQSSCVDSIVRTAAGVPSLHTLLQQRFERPQSSHKSHPTPPSSQGQPCPSPTLIRISKAGQELARGGNAGSGGSCVGAATVRAHLHVWVQLQRQSVAGEGLGHTDGPGALLALTTALALPFAATRGGGFEVSLSVAHVASIITSLGDSFPRCVSCSHCQLHSPACACTPVLYANMLRPAQCAWRPTRQSITQQRFGCW